MYICMRVWVLTFPILDLQWKKASETLSSPSPIASDQPEFDCFYLRYFDPRIAFCIEYYWSNISFMLVTKPRNLRNFYWSIWRYWLRVGRISAKMTQDVEMKDQAVPSNSVSSAIPSPLQRKELNYYTLTYLIYEFEFENLHIYWHWGFQILIDGNWILRGKNKNFDLWALGFWDFITRELQRKNKNFDLWALGSKILLHGNWYFQCKNKNFDFCTLGFSDSVIWELGFFSVRNRILIYGHRGLQIWRRLHRWLRPVHMPGRFVGLFVLFAWPWFWGGSWRLRCSLHSWLLPLCRVLRFTVGCPLIFLR